MKSGMPRLAKTYQPYLSLTGSQTTHAVSLDTGTNRLREAGDTSHVESGVCRTTRTSSVATLGRPLPLHIHADEGASEGYWFRGLWRAGVDHSKLFCRTQIRLMSTEQNHSLWVYLHQI